MIEQAVVVGSDPPMRLVVSVSEHAPSASLSTSGQTTQRVKLLLFSGVRVDPPTRLELRGGDLRVIGTQVAPFPALPSIITCERINPDLPDDVIILDLGDGTLNDETGRLEVSESPLWSGAAHISSGVPATVEAAGESAPLDKVTVTLPLDAPIREGVAIRVTQSRTPGIPGDDFIVSGEVLDSSGSLRRVIAYRSGR